VISGFLDIYPDASVRTRPPNAGSDYATNQVSELGSVNISVYQDPIQLLVWGTNSDLAL
jgi:hypothetical protein